MLGALKNAAAGEHVGENLEYVAEFCEVSKRFTIYIEKIDTIISIIRIVRDRDSNALLRRHIHINSFLDLQIISKRICSDFIEWVTSWFGLSRVIRSLSDAGAFGCSLTGLTRCARSLDNLDH